MSFMISKPRKWKTRKREREREMLMSMDQIELNSYSQSEWMESEAQTHNPKTSLHTTIIVNMFIYASMSFPGAVYNISLRRLRSVFFYSFSFPRFIQYKRELTILCTTCAWENEKVMRINDNLLHSLWYWWSELTTIQR